jgi:diguanylate cyclase (GGDEF)-like protein
MVKSPGNRAIPVDSNRADSLQLREREDSSSLLQTELEELRSELAAANRQIKRLLQERKRSRSTISRLKAMATTDFLTNLINRRRFNEVLEANFAQAVIRDAPISVIMVDVDRFKSYNDTFGHSAGDFVLRVVAQNLMESARTSDVVARYAGDEFAILVHEADAVAAVKCAERYRDAIKAFHWPLRPVTASFGVATRSPSIEDPATLIEEADRALYFSKRSGRTRVIHLGILSPEEISTHLTQKMSPSRTGTPHQDDCRRA